MKRRWSIIMMVVLFLLGCCVLLYPIVSDFWNFSHQSRVAAVYEEAVRQIEEKDHDRILEAARTYNESLRRKASRFIPTGEEDAYYRSLLAMERTDVMAVLEIPSINVYLPVYHGTEDTALRSGIGHVQGSSLPVGGSGTHAVLSGHRGLPSSRLLSDLNRMQIGDRFRIHVLEKVLVYETDQIEVVLPSEMQSLAIAEGEDYVTLLTCTPYGINTHRLLVRGHYVETLTREESKKSSGGNAASYPWKPDRSEVLTLIPVPFLVGVLVMILNQPVKKKKKGSSRRRS